MNTVLYPGRSPCLPRSHFLPFCLQPPAKGSAAFLLLTGFFQHTVAVLLACPLYAGHLPRGMGCMTDFAQRSQARPLDLAESSSRRYMIDIYVQCYGLAVSPPAAPHLVSPRRSSLRSQAGDTSA